MTVSRDQKVSYAQNGEDVRAWRALRHVDRPFYVEVGASHPYDDSLTAALHALGWRGLLVEPDQAMAELLRQARPGDVVVAAAAHSAPGLMTFSSPAARGQGTVSAAGQRSGEDALSVPAVRLADVLADLGPPEIHFVSIDVEGHEREALLGLNLQRWRPWVLCVEATAPDSRKLVHDAWEDLVVDAGYRFVAFDGLNRWYVEPGHLDLAERAAEPLSVLDGILDGWVRQEVVALREQAAGREAADRTVEDLDARLVSALTDLRSARAETESLRVELAILAAQHEAALARESVMLTSKSWRITAPMRKLRLSTGLAMKRRRLDEALDEPAVPAVARSMPGDDRRLLALAARRDAGRSGP